VTAGRRSRLDEIRAELEALETRREARKAERAPAAEIEAAERELADAKALDAAESEHGEIGKKISTVKTELGIVILKRPDAATFRRFRDTGSAKSFDLEKLVRPCLVYPDRVVFDRILEEQPGTLTAMADAVAVLAGIRTEEVAPKS
jgi:hypothetical protein